MHLDELLDRLEGAGARDIGILTQVEVWLLRTSGAVASNVQFQEFQLLRSQVTV